MLTFFKLVVVQSLETYGTSYDSELLSGKTITNLNVLQERQGVDYVTKLILEFPCPILTAKIV